MPRFVKEILITVAAFAALSVFWWFVADRWIALSDQGLLTVATVLSTTMGVLAAVVISFLFIIWQFSRQGRDTAFWRWRDTLRQLVNLFDSNREILRDFREQLERFTVEAQKVHVASPMSPEDFTEFSSEVSRVLWLDAFRAGETQQLSTEDEKRYRAYMDVQTLITDLANARLSHNLSHGLYAIVLRLKDLIYRLLVVLMASVLLVVVGASTALEGISDPFNASLAIVLVGWILWLLIYLWREIKRAVALERQIEKQISDFIANNAH